MTARESKGPRLFVSSGRFFITPSPGSTLILDEADSHYIADVLRLKQGDAVEVGDPLSGVVGQCHISSIADQVTVTLDNLIPATNSLLPRLTLLSALCKGQRNDQICDWATELGCSEIIFWQATRSVVRLKDAGDAEHKQNRLAKIAHAAAQQSKQARPPAVRVTLSLEEALNRLETIVSTQGLRLVCSLTERTRALPEALATHQSTLEVTIAIGPEGDLTSDEESLLTSRGFLAVSLGPNVLRSELAAVTALATTRMLTLRSR